jgi:cytochrome c-type biogenesis protein CcmH/NrfG
MAECASSTAPAQNVLSHAGSSSTMASTQNRVRDFEDASMKTGARATALVILLFFACLCAAQTVSFTLVHINDVHDIRHRRAAKEAGSPGW